MDGHRRFDAHIEVFGPAKVLRVQYDTPYVRNLPVRLSVLDANGEGGAVERRIHPQWGDPFVHEWQAFHHNVTNRAQPESSPADLFARLRARQGAGAPDGDQGHVVLGLAAQELLQRLGDPSDRVRRAIGRGEVHGEPRAVADLGLQLDVAAVGLHQAAGQRQPEKPQHHSRKYAARG